MDHYILDFTRVYFATVQRGMTIAETTFAVQRPRYLVEEYTRMIEEFGLDGQKVYDRVVSGWRCGTTRSSHRWRRMPAKMKDENRRNPLLGEPAPAFPLGQSHSTRKGDCSRQQTHV